jgi:hypothetical protein
VQRKTGRIPRALSGHSALLRRHRQRHPARSPAVPSLLPGGGTVRASPTSIEMCTSITDRRGAS